MRCAKMAEPIEMPLWMMSEVNSRKHVLDRVHIGATWQIRLNHPCVAAMQPFCQITLTTYCPAHVVQWSNHLGAMCSRA